MAKRQSKAIQEFILKNITLYPGNISKKVVEKFALSRQAASRHIGALVKENKLEAHGATRNRTYKLKPFLSESISARIDDKFSEDRIWMDRVKPLLTDLPPNVLRICNYGITEMVNNVIDHSESGVVRINVHQDPINVRLAVIDIGIGIFNKLQKHFEMLDIRQAFLELAKGKLTTDTKKHTGEGIFFSSRMFDEFRIYSGHCMFAHTRYGNSEDDWLIESRDGNFKGTMVTMSISSDSIRTDNEVYAKYTSELNDYGFTKTHVPVVLAQYEGEQLVSRSQAKRLLARFERFQEVLLDFKGVKHIGQSFADEIFRVFRNNNPSIKLFCINTDDSVKNMILRAQNYDQLSTDDSKQETLFKN